MIEEVSSIGATSHVTKAQVIESVARRINVPFRPPAEEKVVVIATATKRTTGRRVEVVGNVG